MAEFKPTEQVILRSACRLIPVLLALASPVQGQRDAFHAPVARREPRESSFAVAPVFERHRGAARLSFELAQPSDVEIAILDAAGAVVRHWAAGLVGGHAAAPLRSDSLTQRLEWDGTDDAGQPATNGPFRTRVRMGSKPRLGRVAGWDGQTPGMPVLGLAVGPDGSIFMLSGDSYRGSAEVRVLDKNGRYQRTILPHGADTPEERLTSLGQITVDEERIPVVFHGQGPALAPLTGGMRRQTMTVSPSGNVLMISGPGSWFDHSGPRHLLALHPEGGAPDEKRFVGPMLSAPAGWLAGKGPGSRPAFDHLAMSPDGKWMYLTLTSAYSKHGVFRVDARQWNTVSVEPTGMSEAFLGQRFQAGSGPGLFNNPQGLATDAEGRIYVCDKGNNRVAVFSANGEKVGQFAVVAPEQIVVHPRTSAIYVLTRPRVEETDADSNTENAEAEPSPSARIVKFSPWRDAGVIRLSEIDGAFDLMAADPVASPTRLWTTSRIAAPGEPKRPRLVPVIDRVNTLSTGTPVFLDHGLRRPMYIAADPARNRVLVREETAAFRPDRDGNPARNRIVALDLSEDTITGLLDADEVAIGLHGEIFALTSGPNGGLKRYRDHGEPWPFPNENEDPNRLDSETRTVPSDRRLLVTRGIRVSPRGDLLVVRSTPWQKDSDTLSRVELWSPDGVLAQATLIDGLGVADSGIGMDASGRLYLGATVAPRRHGLEDTFKGQVPAARWLGWVGEHARRPFPWKFSMVNTYLYDRGSVLMFGPEGGCFHGRSVPWLSSEHRAASERGEGAFALAAAPESSRALQSGFSVRPVKVTGAQWLYYGMSPLPAAEPGRYDAPGAGTSARLVVDPYGRVFVPDALRFSVVMLDSAGNLLNRIGRYGNADDSGEGIRFAWPACLDVAEGKLYVSDRVNQRISIIDFEYAQEVMVSLPETRKGTTP